MGILVGGIIFSCGLFVGSGITMMIVWDQAMKYIHHPELVPARLAEKWTGALN